jgi:hypothetical protein
MKKILSFLLLFALFISPVCYSAVVWQPYYFVDNAGGLNDAFSEFKVSDNEAVDLQNVVFTTSGSFKTRDGFAKVNSSTVGATTVTNGLFFYNQSDGDQFLVSVFDDNTIRKMEATNGPDGTWDDITGALSFSVGQNNLASFAVGEDILIIEDGLNSSAPYQWTGSGNAVALGGSPPNCTMVAYHKRQAFCAGNDSNPSTLYFSDLNDIENWTTSLSGSSLIETNNGSVIQAIKPGFDALYVWKDKSIWRVSGDDKDNYVFERMVEGVGCLSSDCAQIVGNSFIFTDGQGDTYIYDGGIKLRIISNKIQGTLDSSNFDRFSEVRTLIFDKDYYFSLSSVGNNDHDIVMVYDTFNLAWSKFKGMNVNAMAVAENNAGEEAIYFGDYTGFVYEYPSGTDDAGTAIDMYYTTKQYSFTEQGFNKTFRDVNIIASQQGNYNLEVELRTDFEDTGTSQSVNLAATTAQWDSAVFDTDRYGGENLIIGKLEFNKEGQFFQLHFSNSNADEPVEVKGWVPYIEAIDRF